VDNWTGDECGLEMENLTRGGMGNGGGDGGEEDGGRGGVETLIDKSLMEGETGSDVVGAVGRKASQICGVNIEVIISAWAFTAPSPHQ
jgi:hypothetical protein